MSKPDKPTNKRSAVYGTNTNDALPNTKSECAAAPSQKSDHVRSQTSDVMLAVAFYEVVKGVGAVFVAIALIIWHDRLSDWLAMIDAAWGEQFGGILAPPIASSIVIAQRASENWVMFLLLIIGYSGLRFLQAYGLFKDKTWAYWLGIFGYAVLVPVEIFYLLTRPFDWLKLTVLVINCYVVYAVFKQMKRKGFI